MYGNLPDLVTLEPEHGGEKPVHAVEGGDFPQGLFPEGSAGATGIGDPVARDHVPKAVSDPGGDALHKVILALSSDPADCGNPLFQGIQERGNVGGVILTVPVERNDDIALSQPEAAHFGSALPKIQPVPYRVQVGPCLLKAPEKSGSVIRAAIIHADDFIGPVESVQDLLHLLDKEFQVFLLVVSGDHNAQIGLFFS
jgi:hypothetical protein